ncbi:DNA polymerase delta, subunit 4-domain-containing protein [Schizophyllum amplum]|uniref:DNA polymerase delta, subunit 4-domain-containing protein n=1 Tax=Schizophyllum amplum TaxID=97359 RepID=A0A550C1N1_9AGAR|nr:DNA polymerase delta, subunit 4-domain-containing protein [Auriculariopsis ampla]
MPPTRSTKSAAAPKLKQARLSFTASKRTASAHSAKPTKDIVTRTSSTPVLSTRSASPAISISEGSSSSVDNPDRDDIEFVDDEAVVAHLDRARKPRSATKTTPVNPPRHILGPLVEAEPLDVKDQRWNQVHKEAKTLRGGPLVHAEGQNKIHDILRVFDMTYKYGPYVGVPRLERWERAHTLGLNPPVEIRDILVTHEGRTLDEYAQSAVYGKGDVFV